MAGLDEETIYALAMEEVEALAKEAIDRCCEVADENNYERDWIIARFRERFNKKTKDIV